MFTINVHHFHHLDESRGEILAELDKIGRKLESIMATQAELTETLNAVLAQQTKTSGEIVALQASMDTLQQTIVALEEQIATAGALSPELIAAVAAVKTKAQEVDDLIPDAPAPVPV
jgi:predicted  nucleic acid-binding Zn-ribbon protein